MTCQDGVTQVNERAYGAEKESKGLIFLDKDSNPISIQNPDGTNTGTCPN